MSLIGLLAQDSATVESPTFTKDGSGAPRRTFASLYSGVPVSVDSVSSHDQEVYAQRNMVVTHRVYTRQSGIAIGHRILTSDGRYLVVKGVDTFSPPLGAIPTHYRVLCEEVRPGA